MILDSLLGICGRFFLERKKVKKVEKSEKSQKSEKSEKKKISKICFKESLFNSSLHSLGVFASPRPTYHPSPPPKRSFNHKLPLLWRKKLLKTLSDQKTAPYPQNPIQPSQLVYAQTTNTSTQFMEPLHPPLPKRSLFTIIQKTLLKKSIIWRITIVCPIHSIPHPCQMIQIIPIPIRHRQMVQTIIRDCVRKSVWIQWIVSAIIRVQSRVWIPPAQIRIDWVRVIIVDPKTIVHDAIICPVWSVERVRVRGVYWCARVRNRNHRACWICCWICWICRICRICWICCWICWICVFCRICCWICLEV